MIFIKFFKIPWYFQVFQVYSHFSRFSSSSGNPDRNEQIYTFLCYSLLTWYLYLDVTQRLRENRQEAFLQWMSCIPPSFWLLEWCILCRTGRLPGTCCLQTTPESKCLNIISGLQPGKKATWNRTSHCLIPLQMCSVIAYRSHQWLCLHTGPRQACISQCSMILPVIVVLKKISDSKLVYVCDRYHYYLTAKVNILNWQVPFWYPCHPDDSGRTEH